MNIKYGTRIIMVKDYKRERKSGPYTLARKGEEGIIATAKGSKDGTITIKLDYHLLSINNIPLDCIEVVK